jgi:hypothetical protein
MPLPAPDNKKAFGSGQKPKGRLHSRICLWTVSMLGQGNHPSRHWSGTDSRARSFNPKKYSVHVREGQRDIESISDCS